jgi:hypothetical protein
VNEEPQPHEQTAEDRPETVGDLLLKRLGIDPNRWTIGDRRLALLGIGIGLTILIIAVSRILSPLCSATASPYVRSILHHRPWRA